MPAMITAVSTVPEVCASNEWLSSSDTVENYVSIVKRGFNARPRFTN